MPTTFRRRPERRRSPIPPRPTPADDPAGPYEGPSGTLPIRLISPPPGAKLVTGPVNERTSDADQE